MSKKILFIDRDGTLIQEPPVTFQVNNLEELVFLPHVISSLKKFSDSGYQLVIVTNQDGLGTDANPRENYEKINAKMLEIFAGEGVEFLEILECPHLPKENCACRKPKLGMVKNFLQKNDIDYENSYVIGDRQTDIEFAENIGITGILLDPPVKGEARRAGGLNDSDSHPPQPPLSGGSKTWKTITKKILESPRVAIIERETKETKIFVKWNLDGDAEYQVDTGLKFFDHMLEQLGKHGNFDLTIKCQGDLEIDEHHTIEDTALALGTAFKKALGDKRGIIRYAHEKILPMDEALCQCAIDISGRPDCIFTGEFTREYVGDFPTEMLSHFYKSFCDASGLNMNMKIEGKNTHHMVEISFKAFARCLREAVKTEGNAVSSTKGVL